MALLKPDSAAAFYGYSSQSVKHVSLLLGYNGWPNHKLNGWTINYGEVGVAIDNIGTLGYHPLTTAYFVSSEFRANDGKWLIGPKIGAWATGGVSAIAMGLNMIYYTDLKAGTLCLRPEVGFGIDNFRLTYGYNVALANKSFNGVNTNLVSAGLLIGVTKLKETRTVDTTWRSAYLHREKSYDTSIESLSVRLYGGVNGWVYPFAELGAEVCYSELFMTNSKTSGFVMLPHISCEVLLSTRKLFGPKAGVFYQGPRDFGFGIGYSIIYYTDNSNNSWVLQPDAGFHYKSLRLLYGYKFKISKHYYSEVRHSNISILYGIRLHKFKDRREVF